MNREVTQEAEARTRLIMAQIRTKLLEQISKTNEMRFLSHGAGNDDELSRNHFYREAFQLFLEIISDTTNFSEVYTHSVSEAEQQAAAIDITESAMKRFDRIAKSILSKSQREEFKADLLTITKEGIKKINK